MTTQTYFLPQSLDEATSLLSKYGSDVLIMAGGTLAMPLINEGVSVPEKVVGLKKAGLNYLKESNGQYVIGASTTMTQMTAQDDIPILQEAANAVGGWAIRNAATVGGNLFAPPPGGDFAVALLALDAKLTLTSEKGERIISLSDFYTGFMTNVLLPDEIITEISIPIQEGTSAYTKFGRRQANTPSIVTVAAYLVFDGETVSEARIGLNAVGPHPFRATKAEKLLIGKSLDDQAIGDAAEMAAEESEPFTDAIASEWYRRKMVPVIVKRTLKRITR